MASQAEPIVAEAIYKVTGFITRPSRNKHRELLVFQHPTAGVQLPAGTVEIDESIEDAAFREIAEETGLTQVQLIAHLGSTATDLGESHRVCLQPATLQAGPYVDAPTLQWQFGRGSPCRVVDELNGFAEIIYEELNLNVTPAAVRHRFSGWLPQSILARYLERHFFHFQPMGPTAERWIQKAERDFECYWVPLSPKPRLIEGQNDWLNFAYAKLES